MLRVGIIGLGFIGHVHYKAYRALKDKVTIAAICDIERERLDHPGAILGNIDAGPDGVDLSEAALYTDAAKMLAEQKLDLVSIGLPTYLHAKYTRMALEAGVHVFCEKPMALNPAECDSMIAAAEANGKLLQIGHVIRFWPEYGWARDAVQDGRYGKLLAAHFQRLSQTPNWSWQNWLLDSTKSGGAALDLHIHDADYVHYLFGMPNAVFSTGATRVSGGSDHLLTQYLYCGNLAVSAVGGWIMSKAFGFRQAFDLVFERANIQYDSTHSPSLVVQPHDKEPFSPEVSSDSGYDIEISHFVERILGAELPIVLTPQESRESVRLILAEVESAATGKVVAL